MICSSDAKVLYASGVKERDPKKRDVPLSPRAGPSFGPGNPSEARSSEALA